MKVFFTEQAEKNFEDIGDWIAGDSPQRAVSFVRELREKCDELSRFSNAYPVVRRQGRREIRRRPWRGYLILYQVRTEAVLVLYVVNGAQDVDRLLSGDA